MAQTMPRETRDGHWGFRLAAGAFGGLAGGLVFGVLMSIPAVWNAPFFGGTGMLTLIGQLVGLDGASPFHLLYAWLIHIGASIVFGAAFALLVRPSWRASRVIPMALGYAFVLWLVGGFFALRTLTGTPLVMDLAAFANLAGHLAFGLTLGIVYPEFDREEESVARHHRAPGAVR